MVLLWVSLWALSLSFLSSLFLLISFGGCGAAPRPQFSHLLIIHPPAPSQSRGRFDFSLGRIGRTSGKVILRAGLQLTFLSPATSHRAASDFAIFERRNSIPKWQLYVVEFPTIPT